MNQEKTLWITRTAIFVALLVVLQAATAALGNTIITGAVVNMLLVVSVMTCGMMSGLCVAVISPIMAKLIGIGPLWSLIPFIVAGNITLVLIWHFIGNRHWGQKYTSLIIALAAAAAAKFLALYIGIVQIAVPLLLKLPEPQAAVISSMSRASLRTVIWTLFWQKFPRWERPATLDPGAVFSMKLSEKSLKPEILWGFSRMY